MSKNYVWSGRIIVNQRDKHPDVGRIIQNCIEFYTTNDGWRHCATRYSDGFISYYEILKTGTMKINIYEYATADEGDMKIKHDPLRKNQADGKVYSRKEWEKNHRPTCSVYPCDKWDIIHWHSSENNKEEIEE